MKVLARHKHAPLVALDDGTVIDTEELEVVGNGDVSGPGWEMNPDMEMDPRWEEIARADSSSLGVVETRVKKGSRSFRAPSRVRDDLKTMSIDSPLVDGQGLSLEEMNSLVENDSVTGAAEEWMFSVLNKHDDNSDRDHEDVLFSLAEAELDMDAIEAAMDEEEEGDFNDDDNEIEDYESVPKDVVTAAVTPPPGEFSKIVYIAIIEEDDTKSVQDLVALVQTPAGAASAFSYNGEKGWLDDPEAFQSLQAAAPPPIKQLEDWQTESIISQIASTGELSEEAREQPWEEGTQAGEVHAQPESAPVAASGFELQQAGVLWGPDNQHIMSVVLAAGGWGPNAERLRQYWSTGKGGAKIRWNTPGDWTRCRRYLSKYLGPRAAGYCQLMHKRNTGMFTGDRAHRR